MFSCSSGAPLGGGIFIAQLHSASRASSTKKATKLSIVTDAMKNLPYLCDTAAKVDLIQLKPILDSTYLGSHLIYGPKN